MTQRLGLNFQLKLGDFRGIRINAKEAADLSSSSKYPLNQLHKDGTVVTFGNEENRIKKDKFKFAMRAYPYFVAGNTYDISPMIISWIDKLSSIQDYYEHREKGGNWQNKMGNNLVEYTQMAKVLVAFARDDKNGEKERAELIKLCKFLETKPLKIYPLDKNQTIAQSVRLFNNSPKIINESLLVDKNLTLIKVSTNKLEAVNQVFKGRNHLNQKTKRNQSISDFVASEEFKEELQIICGNNDFDFTPFLDL